jgi:hypothetical protein
MARAKPLPVQIRHTLLNAEGLSSRVNLKKDSIQYEFMMQVILSVKSWQEQEILASHCLSGMRGYSYYVVNHDFKVDLNLFS